MTTKPNLALDMILLLAAGQTMGDHQARPESRERAKHLSEAILAKHCSPEEIDQANIRIKRKSLQHKWNQSSS